MQKLTINYFQGNNDQKPKLIKIFREIFGNLLTEPYEDIWNYFIMNSNLISIIFKYENMKEFIMKCRNQGEYEINCVIKYIIGNMYPTMVISQSQKFRNKSPCRKNNLCTYYVWIILERL